MALLVRHNSSHAERPRSGNLPIIVRMGGTFQVHWAKKYQNSTVGLYTSDEAREKEKKPFGAVKSIRFESLTNKKGDMHSYFAVINQDSNDKVAFKGTLTLLFI